MRICLVSTEIIPTPPVGFWGGVESVVYDLANALSGMGYEVLLVGRPGSKSPGDLITTFEEGEMEDIYVEHFKHYKDLIGDCDVVHDHSHGHRAHKVHPRVLHTMHWYQHPAAADFVNICAISETQKRWLEACMEEYGRSEEVHMVHHGIDPKRFRYQEEKDDYYLFFSAIAAYKGALVAYQIAKETGVKMIFAGKAGDADGVIIDDGSSNIIHEGQVSNERRAELMSGAKALIFPTGDFGNADWIEAFGAVQLEAMASGTPVISSNNGACPEIVEHGKTGFVCHSYEEMKRIVGGGWAENIDPRLCRMATVDGKFSSRRMARDYLQLYDDL